MPALRGGGAEDSLLSHFRLVLAHSLPDSLSFLSGRNPPLLLTMSSYSDDEDAPQDKEAVAYGMVLNLVMLSVAATIGLFYSCKFFHSPDVMVIPGQSPAQSFVMFAVCFLSLYILLQIGPTGWRVALPEFYSSRGSNHDAKQNNSQRSQPYTA